MNNLSPLVGKHILLGLTGGIACYKSAELTRLLTQAGCTVQVVMTEAAQHFITPTTMQALSNNPVYTTTWDRTTSNNMAHINLSRQADLMIIAPATADFIAKLAQGRADDLLSTLCLARTCPLAVVPAMNKQMWDNPAQQRNIKQIQEDGVLQWGPNHGAQACGEVGEGRMLEPAQIMAHLETFLSPKPLLGKTVLLTAGPTFEAIDPVRGITNRSSGKMGYALAQAAAHYGAKVILVSGPTHLAVPFGVQVIDVESAKQMYEAVHQHGDNCDVFIGVAAVADWGIDQLAPHKLKKIDGQDELVLRLSKNPDILASVATLKKKPYMVGFAAETENLEAYARKKLVAKNLDLIIANLATQTFGQNHNQVLVIDANQTTSLPDMDKNYLANHLMALIADKLSQK